MYMIQSWRMDVLDRYIEAQKEHTAAAYTGAMSNTYAGKIMATVGTKGTGTMKHHSITHGTSTITALVYYDIGTYTSVASTPRNDSTEVLQTSTRIYMVSQHRVEGSPLSMADTRIMAPITAHCATMVHLQQGIYRVVQGGDITCMDANGNSKTWQVEVGQNMHVADTHSCNSTCIAIGHKPFTAIHKSMPEQPTVHHNKMIASILKPKDRHDMPIQENSKQAHHTEHSMLGQNIREAQDMLEELQSQNGVPDLGVHLGLAGTVCSVLFSLLLLAILVRWRCRSVRAPNTPSKADVATNNNNTAPIEAFI